MFKAGFYRTGKLLAFHFPVICSSSLLARGAEAETNIYTVTSPSLAVIMASNKLKDVQKACTDLSRSFKQGQGLWGSGVFQRVLCFDHLLSKLPAKTWVLLNFDAGIEDYGFKLYAPFADGKFPDEQDEPFAEVRLKAQLPLETVLEDESLVRALVADLLLQAPFAFVMEKPISTPQSLLGFATAKATAEFPKNAKINLYSLKHSFGTGIFLADFHEEIHFMNKNSGKSDQNREKKGITSAPIWGQFSPVSQKKVHAALQLEIRERLRLLQQKVREIAHVKGAPLRMRTDNYSFEAAVPLFLKESKSSIYKVGRKVILNRDMDVRMTMESINKKEFQKKISTELQMSTFYNHFSLRLLNPNFPVNLSGGPAIGMHSLTFIVSKNGDTSAERSGKVDADTLSVGIAGSLLTQFSWANVFVNVGSNKGIFIGKSGITSSVWWQIGSEIKVPICTDRRARWDCALLVSWKDDINKVEFGQSITVGEGVTLKGLQSSIFSLLLGVSLSF